ncbi:MAG: ribose-phosphate pyrophosphokinase-like domain-containing protein [Alphaproteobacteria bacterium]
MDNGSQLSAAIKILDIDLSPVAQKIAQGVKLPIVTQVTAARPGALCEEIIAALEKRATSIDKESLFADYTLTMFKGGEQKIEYGESVAGHQVFLVLDFPTLDEKSVPPEFYELASTTFLNNYLHLAKQAAEAARAAGAAEVHLIMPNHADARQDQRHGERGPATVAIVARELADFFDSITCLHLHAPQIEGIYAALGKLFRNLSPNEIHGPGFVCRDPDTLQPILPKAVTLEGVTRLLNRVCVASPDVGGAKVARNFIKYCRRLAAAIVYENTQSNNAPLAEGAQFIPSLIKHYVKLAAAALARNPQALSFENLLKAMPDIPLVIVDKSRPSANVSEIVNVLGIEFAKGRDCTLFDDMGDGLGTMINAAEALIDAGASTAEGRVSHGYFSGDALKLITDSRIKQVVVGNGMALRPSVLEHPKIQVISLAPAFAQVIVDMATKPTANVTFAARHTHDPHFRKLSGRFAGPMLGSLNQS